MSSGGFDGFYQGLGAELWRQAPSAEETEAEINFIVEALDLEEGASLLDVPCGNGRHGLGLLQQGYQVTGVDLSSDYLKEARTSAGKKGLSYQDLLYKDMRELAFEGQFDGAYCLGNSFGFLERDDLLRFARGVARSLKRGTRFLIESGNVAESLLPHFEERLWKQVGDLLVVMENHYDPAESCLHTDYTIIKGNHRETRSAQQWIYTLADLRRLLDEAGLETVGFAADTDATPYEVGAERLYLVAQKTA